jgi:hypothetical protein
MSSSGGLGIRTIWIALRAANYTQQAFSSIQKSIDVTIDKEKKMDTTNKQLTASALKFFDAGLMMGTLGVSLAGAIWNIASSSREGAGDFARLNQQMFLTQQAFANTFYEILKSTHVLEYINIILKTVANNKGLQVVLFGVIALGAGLAILFGAYMLARAGLLLFSQQALTSQIAIQMLKTGFTGLSLSAQSLGAALGLAFGAFTIFFMLGSMLSGPAKEIAKILGIIALAAIGVAVAVALATGGLSALTGQAGVAAVLGTAGAVGLVAGTSMSSFPIGTRSVSKDMNARVHKGEVIYNPNTNNPLQVGNDLGNGGRTSTTNNYFSMPISQMNTKADFDDVNNVINKALLKSAKSVR